jgi:hypothetical protein
VTHVGEEHTLGFGSGLSFAGEFLGAGECLGELFVLNREFRPPFGELFGAFVNQIG